MRHWCWIWTTLFATCLGLEVIPLLEEEGEEQQRIVLVRIRKTGTHTLASALKECSFAACEKVFDCDSTPPDRRRYCSLDGFCLSWALLTHGVFVVTMVRNPVRRVLLEFASACSRGHADYSVAEWRKVERIQVPEDCERRVNESALFESFLVAPAHVNGARNRQTRTLAGAVMSHGLVDVRSEPELYEIALRNIETFFDMVLVFESLQESMFQLAKKLGLAPLLTYSLRRDWAKHLSVKPQLDPDTLDLVRRFNQFDELLYRRAAEKLFSSSEGQNSSYYDCVENENTRHCRLKDQLRDNSQEEMYQNRSRRAHSSSSSRLSSSSRGKHHHHQE